MAICEEIIIEHKLLEMRPHPEDRAQTWERLDRLHEEKDRRCKCGKLNE